MKLSLIGLRWSTFEAWMDCVNHALRRAQLHRPAMKWRSMVPKTIRRRALGRPAPRPLLVTKSRGHVNDQKVDLKAVGLDLITKTHWKVDHSRGIHFLHTEAQDRLTELFLSRNPALLWPRLPSSTPRPAVGVEQVLVLVGGTAVLSLGIDRFDPCLPVHEELSSTLDIQSWYVRSVHGARNSSGRSAV
ncbi:hypothetical protein Cgig2_011104 [Carnegiea gigantea]|uniref:Uncharacterized protein n=1 Tax=Carnegiea gigantea TaxID=171969 RepID=A0A9Q1Q7P0_9CARY|nr:hypothetical protein Cgig2_011104 [Carnegiea gigantea]